MEWSIIIFATLLIILLSIIFGSKLMGFYKILQLSQKYMSVFNKSDDIVIDSNTPEYQITPNGKSIKFMYTDNDDFRRVAYIQRNQNLNRIGSKIYGVINNDRTELSVENDIPLYLTPADIGFDSVIIKRKNTEIEILKDNLIDNEPSAKSVDLIDSW